MLQFALFKCQLKIEDDDQQRPGDGAPSITTNILCISYNLLFKPSPSSSSTVIVSTAPRTIRIRSGSPRIALVMDGSVLIKFSANPGRDEKKINYGWKSMNYTRRIRGSR